MFVKRSDCEILYCKTRITLLYRISLFLHDYNFMLTFFFCEKEDLLFSLKDFTRYFNLGDS